MWLLALLVTVVLGGFAGGLLLARAQSHSVPVPAEPVGVVIRIYPPRFGPASPFPLVDHPLQVRDTAAVRQLVADLNQSTVPSHRAMSCPTGSGSRATLHFLYPSNDRWTVTVDDTTCLTVSVHGTTWLALKNGNSLVRDFASLPTRSH